MAASDDKIRAVVAVFVADLAASFAVRKDLPPTRERCGNCSIKMYCFILFLN